MGRDKASLKRRLAERELTIGSWISCGDAGVCELMAKAGFEWLVVDMEHTSLSTAQQAGLIQITELAGCVPLVRVGANDPLLIKRAMDSGAHGVIVPMVNAAEDAERAVRAAYYPPAGNRGVGLARAQRWGLEFSGYLERAARETIVIAQIEHIDAVRNLSEIVNTEGIDGFIVGPYDLSGSLGLPGEWDHPTVREALDTVETWMRQSSKPGGFHVVHSDRDELQRRIQTGYRFIAYGDDMVFLAEKLREEIAFLRALNRGGSS